MELDGESLIGTDPRVEGLTIEIAPGIMIKEVPKKLPPRPKNRPNMRPAICCNCEQKDPSKFIKYGTKKWYSYTCAQCKSLPTPKPIQSHLDSYYKDIKDLGEDQLLCSGCDYPVKKCECPKCESCKKTYPCACSNPKPPYKSKGRDSSVVQEFLTLIGLQDDEAD